MYKTTNQISSKITSAKEQISTLFVTQCKYGKQTTNLPKNVASCGQFLKVPNQPQRGLHGTAAALRVLWNNSNRDLVLRMVEYIRHRNDIEKAPEELKKSTRDFNNVIKLSEAVIALKRIPEASDIVTQFVKQIKDGFMQGSGWSWFVDSQSTLEIIPTSFACLALNQIGNGEEVNEAYSYLLKYLKQNYSKSNSSKKHVDTITDTFCLYVITEIITERAELEERKFLRKTFEQIWQRLVPLLDEDLEQNIEYWDGNDTCYVRIPWQLYLLSLSANYRIHRRFGSWIAQKKLNHIFETVMDDNYVYPYSGKFLSSRTYSILYETMEVIQSKISNRQLLPFFILWDRIVSLFHTKIARYIVFILVTLLQIYIGYRWFHISSENDYSSIFCSVFASYLVIALSWAQRSH